MAQYNDYNLQYVTASDYKHTHLRREVPWLETGSCAGIGTDSRTGLETSSRSVLETGPCTGLGTGSRTGQGTGTLTIVGGISISEV